jgi:hypothetical protein
MTASGVQKTDSQLFGEKDKEQDGRHDDHHDAHRTVRIVVNNEPVGIARGRRAVLEIKRVAGVPEGDALAMVKGGKLVPLADDAFIVLKGGEEFISHPKDAASSSTAAA